MRIGIGPYYIKYGYSEGGERMRRHGYDALDYDLYSRTHTDLYNGDTAEEFIETTKRRKSELDKMGVPINQIHGPWRWPVQDATEEDRAERFEKMSRAIIAAEILGAKYMAIHPLMPFGADSPDNPEELYRLNREFYTALADVGARHGVTVCLENMPFLNFPLASVPALLAFVKDIDHPYLKMCLDTGHANMFPLSIGDCVRLIGKDTLKILHVHDNDGKGDRHWNPGEGTADWEDFTAALKEIDFDGVVSLETGVHSDATGDELERLEIALAEKAKKIADKT